MTSSELQAKAEQIKEAFAQMDGKRVLWQQETKALLQTVLRRIAKESGLDLQSQTLTGTTNGETVNLMFNVAHSGMVKQKGQGFEVLTKHGGYIYFAQLYNGDVVVNIQYPYVEERIPQQEGRFLEKVHPRVITEEFIYKNVGIFFDEMLRWETDLGFAS